MKILTIIFLLLFFVSNVLTQHNCYTTDSLINSTKAGGCSDYESYVPNPNNMELYSNLTYKVNVHFFRKSDGTGIYQPPLDLIIVDLFNYVNLHFDNLLSPSLEVSPQILEIPSSKIQFELQNVYWHDDDNYYDYENNCGSFHYDQYAVNPSCEINIFYYHSDNFDGGCGPYPFVNFFGDEVPNWQEGGWAHSQLIAHELGHVLGLPHTFSGCSDDVFDDTYHPDPNKNWIGCGNSVPYSQCGGGTGVSNNIMGCNKCRSYLSPKQIAKMRYLAISNESRRKFLVDTYSSNNTIEVNSNQTWDYGKFVTGDLIVKTGNTLTVKCKIHFSAESKVVVEKGAKLIIDGGLLTSAGTSACSGEERFWQGIQVYGTSDKHQFPSQQPTYQGMLILKNGGTIENAFKAVTNWHGDHWNEIGGVIQSTDGIFRNNRRDVEFMSYTNHAPNNPNNILPNNSYFRNTDFITDDDFIENGMPQNTHVTLWEVDGINFTNCHFANNITTDKDISSSPSKGIYSLDASFKIVAGCSSQLPFGQPCPTSNLLKSSFTGLQTAIEAANAGTSKTLTVSQSEFINNAWGVRLDEIDNVSINRNEFEVGKAGYTPTFAIGAGVYSDNSTGYLIEENTVSAPFGFGYYYGIGATNSGIDNNRFYKNDLQGLFWGTYAEGINHNSNYQTGLQFLCNDYSDNLRAISIESSPSTDGVRFYQGDFAPNKAAGNTFLNNLLDIENNANSIVYYYNGINSMPVNFTGLVTPILATDDNTCPTSFGGGGGIIISFKSMDSLNTVLDELIDKYNNLQFNYLSMIDGGNTANLQSQIETNWSNDEWLLRGNLIEKSPFLSKDVLLKTAEQNILPNGMLLEVLLANPDATRGEDFIEKLKVATNNSFPEYMIDYVRNNYDKKTLRTSLEGQMSAVHSELSSTRNYIKYLRKSKDEYTYEDRLNTVKMGNSLSSKVGVMDFYIENEQYGKADSVLQVVQNDKNMQDGVALINNFGEYISFRASLGNRSIAQLDSTEIAFLKALAKDKGRVAGYAQNILCFFYDICFEKELLNLDSKQKSMMVTGVTPEIEDIMYNVTVYPNPSEEFTSIKWEIYDELQNAHYKVFDLNGQEIMSGIIDDNKGEKVLDLRAIKNGLYIIGIYNNDIKKVNKKLIVNKTR